MNSLLNFCISKKQIHIAKLYGKKARDKARVKSKGKKQEKKVKNQISTVNLPVWFMYRDAAAKICRVTDISLDDEHSLVNP